MVIKFEETDKDLSIFGGLSIFRSTFSKIYYKVDWEKELPIFPKASKKFEDLVMGFAADAQCLADMEQRSEDTGFQAVCDDKVYTAKSYGNYLRAFEPVHIDGLNQKLSQSSYISRVSLPQAPKDRMTLDFDSTGNEHHAQKMEGVAYSGDYEMECLTTMYVFDELGLPYYADVRPGTTSTSHQISKIIHLVLNQMPKEGTYAGEQMNIPGLDKVYKKDFKVFARADSGYSNSEFMNACEAKNVGYVVRLRANMLAPHIQYISNWKSPKKRIVKKKRRAGVIEEIDKTIRFYDGRDCEIGTTFYTSEKIVNAPRIVCMRAKKPGRLGVSDEDYDYFAFASNIGEHEKSNENLIYFYRGRGNAENYIKEMKNGFDLHHYPCLKLNANRAYAVIAAYSYAAMRFMSLQDSEGKNPLYAKGVRHKLIFLPVQVVRTGGQIIFRFMKKHLRRMKDWKRKLNTLQFGFT